MATRVALGTASFRIWSRFPSMSEIGVFVVPVTFPPGCLRLETSPCPTGSFGKIMTMGMVLVACLAASAADAAGALLDDVRPIRLRIADAAASVRNRDNRRAVVAAHPPYAILRPTDRCTL